MGLVAPLFFILLFTLFVGYKVGFSNLSIKLYNVIIPVTQESKYKKILYLPDDILSELTELKAPIGNAGNPTNT